MKVVKWAGVALIVVLAALEGWSIAGWVIETRYDLAYLRAARLSYLKEVRKPVKTETPRPE